MSRRRACLGLFLSMILVAVVQNSSFGQLPVDDLADERPTGCGNIRTVLDAALLDAKNLPKNSFAIFLFRRGNGENKESLIQDRMSAVKRHVEFRNLDLDNYILAEGERHPGLGRLDIFIEGKLSSVLYFPRNEDLGSTCRDEPN